MYPLLLPVLLFAAPIAAESNRFEGMSLEFGVNRETITQDDEWAHWSAIISSFRRSGQFYGQWFIGSLNGNHPSGFLGAEVGYWKGFHDGWFARGSFGLAIVTDTGWKLSTHNEFTEALAIGRGNFFFSYRHISNGGSMTNNPGPNNGEDLFSLGYLRGF